MAGFIIKLIFCPLVVYLASLLMPNQVHYTVFYHWLSVGWIIASVGQLMEVFMLKRGTVLISTAADFVAAGLLLYYLSPLFSGAIVTFWGALITALVLTATEYFIHVYLVKNRMVETNK